MAKLSVKQFYTTESFQTYLQELEAKKATHDLEREQLASKYEEELKRVEVRFLDYEKEFLQDYLRLVNDHHAILDEINSDSDRVFHEIDQRYVEQQKEINQLIAKENEEYHLVLNAFEDLRKEAKKSYDLLCAETDQLIEEEIRMHREFVGQKELAFQQLKDLYTTTNNDHYNELLWAMEKSKNALENLKQLLDDQSFENIKALNQHALNLLEELRDTKNKITQLFKLTTTKFNRRRDEIEQMGIERQLPHTVVNQRLIDSYIKQIRVVNDKKLQLDQLIQDDFQKAKSTIGKKILDAEAKQEKVLLERYILQYEIVQTKANYLLRHNQELSDLTIHKYQNEIEKLKIDSFRRREEIKLTYHLPFAFCQSSISLYSNFAFYVSETFDRFDIMISDFIQNVKEYVEPKYHYLHESAKTFEDYKLNVHVLTNTITNQITELLVEVDQVSKEIVTLESNNRIEVAEIEKAMEHADITSDYEKYIAGLDNDYFLAHYQHELNLKKIKNEANHRSNLMTIERTRQSLKKREMQFEMATTSAKQLNKIERDIKDAHFDYELAIEELTYRRDKTLLERFQDQQSDLIEEQFLKEVYTTSRMVELKQYRFDQMKRQGSQFIIEAVNAVQRIIDLSSLDHQDSYATYVNQPLSNDLLHSIYQKRQRALDYIDYRHQQNTQKATQAVRFYHRIFFTLEQTIRHQVQDLITPWKKDLVQLSTDNTLVCLSKWRHHGFYQQQTIHTINQVFHRMYETLLFFPHEVSTKAFEELEVQTQSSILPILHEFSR